MNWSFISRSTNARDWRAAFTITTQTDMRSSRSARAKRQLEAMLDDAQFAMGAAAPPQILITMAARFGRVSWKYSGFAYSLVLKHVGVLMQTLYLMATEMELGACAIGVGDIDLFARMTGLEFHVEGAVGQMAIGRAGDIGSPLDDV